MNKKDLRIILETVSGSNAYGTNTPDSDLDIRGIAIPPLKYYLGFVNRFKQKDKWDNYKDKVIYDLQKFFKLAANCNPNILELLYVDEGDIIKIDALGRKLRENRELFLSKKCRYSYAGYAYSQYKRMKTHRGFLLNPPKKAPERSDFGLPETKKLISTDQMGAFLWLVSMLIKNTVEEAKLSYETIKELKNINYIGILQSHIPDEAYPAIKDLTGASDNFIEACMREKKYAAAMANWKSYQTWKTTRNPKRAELERRLGFDGKNASHLVRLVRTGKEILEGKEVIVKRPDAKELLEIKNGAWTYEQIEKYMNEMDIIMDDLYQKSTLRHSPDRNKLDGLCMEIIQEAQNDKEIWWKDAVK